MPHMKTIGEPIPVAILTSSEIIAPENSREDRPPENGAARPASPPSWPQFATGMLFLPFVAWTASVDSYLNFLQRLHIDSLSGQHR